MTAIGKRAVDYATLPTLTHDLARQAAHQLLALRGDGEPVPAAKLAAIEQFYRREARLLDEERYAEWYDLLADDLFYWLPLTENRFRRDARPRIAAENMAIFDERKADIAVRIGRLDSRLVWTEDPPTRHVYVVSNVEAFATGVDNEYECHSTFLQYRNRAERDESTLVGRRRDVLRQVGGGFQLARRLIVLPQAVLLTKSLSVFF